MTYQQRVPLPQGTLQDVDDQLLDVVFAVETPNAVDERLVVVDVGSGGVVVVVVQHGALVSERRRVEVVADEARLRDRLHLEGERLDGDEIALGDVLRLRTLSGLQKNVLILDDFRAERRREV